MICVEGTPKQEVLVFGIAPEQPFGGFIESFGDMVQHGRGAIPGRALEFLFQKFPCPAADEYRTREKT
jgi:hypothetical protein